MSQMMWEQRYAQPDRVWSQQPNHWLTQLVADVEPGTACDVACGEGADAIWLARCGWKVTAVDFAASALARGQEEAAAAGVADRITWLQQDLVQWTPEPQQFDLVTVSFFHADRQTRRHVHRQAWRATRGRLLIIGHDPTNVVEGHGGPPDPAVLYDAVDVVESLTAPIAGDIVVAQRQARNSDDPASIMWDSVVMIDRTGAAGQ